jgi:(p)ppGpp synthase/HD superfamily hydrolase
LHNHSDHVAQQLADWSTQYDILTDALLHYCHHHETTAPSPAIDSSFSMEVVDIFGESKSLSSAFHIFDVA